VFCFHCAVLYRAKQHRDMELMRNLELEAVAVYIQKFCRRKTVEMLEARCKMCKPILAAAVASRDVDKVKAALDRAAAVGFEIFEVQAAKRMLFVFEEERRLQKMFGSLVRQDKHEFYDNYHEALASADDIQMQSVAIVDEARRIHAQANAERAQLDADAVEEKNFFREDVMVELCQREIAMCFTSQPVQYLKGLLEGDAANLVKQQYKAAVGRHDDDAIMAKTIRLKELVFEESGDMFKFNLYSQLLSKQDWAATKLITFNRDGLAEGMLSWTKSPIHYTLTIISEKAIRKDALKLFKNVLGYMGDKKYSYPMQAAEELISKCIAEPRLRSEIYCMVIKQLTKNPSGSSTSKGWELLLLLVNTVNPGNFDNFLEMFLREKANPREKYLYPLHQTLYGTVRTRAPGESELRAMLTSTRWTGEQEQKSSQGNSRSAPAPPSGRRAPAPPKRAAVEMDQQVMWHFVDVNDNQLADKNAADLKRAAGQGMFTQASLVWNESLPNWSAAGDLSDLKAYIWG
jgi:hypothetical protein